MKKFLALWLAVVLTFVMLPGCNTGSAADTGATETEEPEVFVSSTLIENGASDYVIVHDGSSETRTLANEIKTAISSAEIFKWLFSQKKA